MSARARTIANGLIFSAILVSLSHCGSDPNPACAPPSDTSIHIGVTSSLARGELRLYGACEGARCTEPTPTGCGEWTASATGGVGSTCEVDLLVDDTLVYRSFVGNSPLACGAFTGFELDIESANVSDKDSGSSGDVDASLPDCPGATPTAADLDATGGWNPPAPAVTNACTSADLAQLLANFDNTSITGYNQLETNLSASCVACAFSIESAATWGTIVLSASDGTQGFINFGACYGDEISVACGKAQQYSELCFSASCSQCADADFQTCEQLSSVAQACQTNFAAAVQSSCAGSADGAPSIDDICNNAIYGVAALCGGTAPDAG